MYTCMWQCVLHAYRVRCCVWQFGASQKLRLVRILRSTVMVRVGGGWVALDEFLVKNDPCRGTQSLLVFCCTDWFDVECSWTVVVLSETVIVSVLLFWQCSIGENVSQWVCQLVKVCRCARSVALVALKLRCGRVLTGAQCGDNCSAVAYLCLYLLWICAVTVCMLSGIQWLCVTNCVHTLMSIYYVQFMAGASDISISRNNFNISMSWKAFQV